MIATMAPRHQDTQRFFFKKATTTNRWVYPSGLNNITATKTRRHQDAQRKLNT